MENEARKKIRIMYLIIRMVMLCHWVACAFFMMTNENWLFLNEYLLTKSEYEKEEMVRQHKIKWDY
mgnify:CR=1 FL=1